MRHLILVLIVALVVAGIAYCVAWLLTGRDSGLEDVEPDGRAAPLPSTRPLVEPDIAAVRFDTTLRGYRMDQVDAALRRAAYDVGYKGELISVLEAEIDALRDGRSADAETLRRARTGAAAAAAGTPPTGTEAPAGIDAPTGIDAPAAGAAVMVDQGESVDATADDAQAGVIS